MLNTSFLPITADLLLPTYVTIVMQRFKNTSQTTIVYTLIQMFVFKQKNVKKYYSFDIYIYRSDSPSPHRPPP